MRFCSAAVVCFGILGFAIAFLVPLSVVVPVYQREFHAQITNGRLELEYRRPEGVVEYGGDSWQVGYIGFSYSKLRSAGRRTGPPQFVPSDTLHCGMNSEAQHEHIHALRDRAAAETNRLGGMGSWVIYGARIELWFLVGASGGVFCAAGLSEHMARKRRRSRGLCEACCYDLTANVSGVCPECGTIVRGSR